jgi:uncharacterized protein GlcG (DUF336 family)
LFVLEIRRLSVDEAHILIEGSVAASRDINVPMCIAVVDESGNLIAFERMDGGKISSISIAIDKAATAARAPTGRTSIISCVYRDSPLSAST